MTRNSCNLILVLAACAVPLVTAIVNAEQADKPIGQSSALANDRATQDYLNSLNPQRKRDKDEEARAEALERAAAAPQSSNAQGVDGLGAEEGPGSSLRSPDTAEHGWIIALAVAGLATSLAAAAYVAWSRRQRDYGTMTVLMPHARPQASDKPSIAPATEREKRPERRAA